MQACTVYVELSLVTIHCEEAIGYEATYENNSNWVAWNDHNTRRINPLAAKLFNLNFHPLEDVSRWRDPQLQVSENYLNLTKWMSKLSNSADYCHFLSLTCLKADI